MSGNTGRELWLLRHAKSAWDTTAPTDFERPLGERGRQDAERLGLWMVDEGLVPDRVVTSPARRTLETCALVLAGMDVPVAEDERIYDADLADLEAVVRRTSGDVARVLLVGHNPGFDELLFNLTDGPLPRTPKGKLMTTCTLARLRLPGAWADPASGRARLLGLTRPVRDRSL